MRVFVSRRHESKFDGAEEMNWATKLLLGRTQLLALDGSTTESCTLPMNVDE